MDRFSSALTAGILSAATAWGLDHLLAFITLGYPLPQEPRFGLAYALCGAVAGLLVAASSRAASTLMLWAGALALIYAVPIFERLYQMSAARMPLAAALLLALAAVGGYGAWIWLLQRLTRSPSAACWIAAGTAAVGLAVNRNLVTRALDVEALFADAAIVLVAVAFALLFRWRGARVAGSVALAALALAAGWVAIGPDRSPSPEPSQVSAARSEKGRTPDLLLVVVDTLRLDVFESVVSETPEGRAFAESLGPAVWFDNAIAAAPWTAPSVGSILTGLYPQEHGFGAQSPSQDPNRPLRRLADAVPTLASRLRNRGYLTEAIGTNPILHPVSGIDRGFDSYELLPGSTTKLPLLTALAKAGALRDEFYQPASAVRRLLKRRLHRLPADRPLFLWLHLMDPHEPLHAHPDLPPDPGTERRSGKERLYREEVRFTLAELSAMIDLLKEHGRWADALLVLVSDHGEMFPSDGHPTGVIDRRTGEEKLYGHGHALYGELVRVPLVVRPPGGLRATRHVGVLTSHTDLHDTIVEVLDVDIPKVGRDRVSLAPFLAPALDRPADLPRRPFALIGANQQGPRQRALRTHDLKLIEYLEPPERSELFDVLQDPQEHHDIAEREPERLPLVRRLLRNQLALLDDLPEAEDMEIDDETRRQLEALGYL